MRNIAILVNTLESGGAEKQSIYLLNALSDNYKINLIVFYGERVEDKLVKLIKGGNYNLIKLEGHSLIKIFHIYKILKSNNISHLFTYLTKPNFFSNNIFQYGNFKVLFMV